MTPMMLFTHMRIARQCFAAMKGSQEPAFKVEWWPFLYGNIKPDLSGMAMVKHHFSDTYQIFKDHLEQSRDRSLTSRERSLALGVACHFICDYFCKFHAVHPFNQRPMLSHILYEIKLHLAIVSYLPVDGKQAAGLVPAGETLSAEEELVRLLSEYHRSVQHTMTDMAYAFRALGTVITTK